MTDTLKTQYPTLGRIKAVSKESQAIGEFLEWATANGFTLCEKTTWATVPWAPTLMTVEGLLARYYDIDLAAAELERRSILEGLSA